VVFFTPAPHQSQWVRQAMVLLMCCSCAASAAFSLSLRQSLREAGDGGVGGITLIIHGGQCAKGQLQVPPRVRQLLHLFYHLWFEPERIVFCGVIR
jgi:hypothetical protein